MSLTQQQRDDILLSQAGLTPTFSPRVFATGATPRPRLATDGVSVKNNAGVAPLGDVLIAAAAVDLGRSYPQAIYQLNGSPATQTYTATVGGTAYNYSGLSSQTASEILAGVADAINAGDVATAELVTLANSATASLLVTSKSASSTTFTGNHLNVIREATSVDFKVWIYTGDSAIGYEWGVGNGAVVTEQTTSWREWPFVGPATRAYIQITAANGLVSWSLGTCKSVAS